MRVPGVDEEEDEFCMNEAGVTMAAATRGHFYSRDGWIRIFVVAVEDFLKSITRLGVQYSNKQIEFLHLVFSGACGV
ncbi:hypothetical protein RRG08_038385 [Elysia crispata]|uniref:Uncharacterized protein n=1 Tax=Elysia crispata TaxID=231223 RepID=A0AAE1A8Y4_9GAST|nr:hypothetical protein RRG08_038385 [Elysia crispata]